MLYPDSKKYKCDLYEHTNRSEAVSKNQSIKQEGIYFFGGMNEYGYSVNTLAVLKIQRRNFEWIIPEVQGKPPAPRYGHSMHLIDWLNSIFIYGGRCDSDMISKDKKSKLFNDLWMLNLKELEWTQVESKGEVPSPLYAHNSAIYGSQMIIFGGIRDAHSSNNDQMNLQYNTNVLGVCELHQRRANLLNREYDVKNLVAKKRMERLEKADKAKEWITKGFPPSIHEESLDLNVSRIDQTIDNVGERSYISYSRSPRKVDKRMSQLLLNLDKLENEEYSFIRED